MFSKIVVLGAGYGGLAMAADLSMAGYKVNLFDLPEFSKNLEPVIEKGGIDVIARTPRGEEFQLPGGGKTGFAKITGKITSNIKEAIEGVDLIMVVVHGYKRERYIKEFAPYLQNGQTMIIWFAYCGATRVVKILKDMNINKKITICETDSLIYASKLIHPGGVVITGVKEKCLFASFPSKRSIEILKELNKIYPQVKPVKNILETSIANTSAQVHSCSTLLNLYRVERKFYPYFDSIGGPLCSNYDITPGMANVINEVDKERINLGKGLGFELVNMKEQLKEWYGTQGKDLYETILNCYPYYMQSAPTSLQHQYIIDDVPFGLVPFISLGEKINVKMPITRAIISLACAATKKNFWSEGLTCEKLGLNNMTEQGITEYVEQS